MFKKLNQYLKDKLQKGQALVFLAISAPLLLTFMGAAADFGWLYINQLRLQNAADAAVIAGAKKLIFDEQSLSDYTYSRIVANYDEGLARLVRDKTISKRDTSEGDTEAKFWAKLNLKDWLGNEDLKIVDISPPRGSSISNDTTPDEWNTVKFKRVLYGSDNKDYQSLYYTVILSEKLEHLLNPLGVLDIFELPTAKALAVAKISHYHLDEVDTEDPLHGPSLYDQMAELRDKENYVHWWEIYDEYKGQPNDVRRQLYGTTDLMTIARSRSVQAKGNEYVDGNFYRTETLTLSGWSKAAKEQGSTQGNVLDQRYLDNLFIDFKLDVNKTFSKDEDVASTQTGYNLYTDNTKVTDAKVLKYRIHDLINVGKYNKLTDSYEYVYKVRDDKDPPDPLYVYIESENSYNQSKLGQGGNGFNTVRQIIINVNVANTLSNDRPIFFFYDGPEKIDGKGETLGEEKWRETWKHLGYKDNDYIGNGRNSLPVILNLNANFRGVLFMPNSPVVINGNKHDFEGFVVAEKFLRLRKATDFIEEAKGGTFTNLKQDERSNEYYYVDDDGYLLYHKKAEGGKRYIQIITTYYNNQKFIRYRNVVYATGTFSKATKNPVDNDIFLKDNVYMDSDGKYFEIPQSSSNILYTYTWMNEENSNLISYTNNKDGYKDAKDYEKEKVKLCPMYIDEFGDVIYDKLTGDYTYTDRPTPNDSNYDKIIDEYEVIYKPSTFNLNSAKYNSYCKVMLVDYTKLNDTNKNINDVFFTTIRSSYLD